MWFPTDMAAFDFAVKITRFEDIARAHQLVCAVAEALDRVGADHLLVDLNRDGQAMWSELYDCDPIVISGSTPMLGVFEDRVLAAARELVPEADVTIDWRGHDPDRAAVCAVNREIERVARVFRGFARGSVPARVRLAILNPDAYLARFGHQHADHERQRPAELTLNALYNALSDAGTVVGIDWKSNPSEALKAFGGLRVLPPARPVTDYVDYTGFVDRWVAADEAELAAADPTDSRYAVTEDHLHAALFDAIREALAVVPADGVPGGDLVLEHERVGGGVPGRATPISVGGRSEWLAEPAMSSSPSLSASTTRRRAARLRNRRV